MGSYLTNHSVICVLPAIMPSPFTSVRGSFSNDDSDGNENVKKATGLLRNNVARASRFFVYFFTVLARLRRENA